MNSKATSSYSNPLNTAGMLVIGKDGGSNTFHITELNLWDRELSEDEISKNAKQCDGLKGSVKSWHEFYETANEKGNEVISSPSQCKKKSQYKASGSSRSTSPAKRRNPIRIEKAARASRHFESNLRGNLERTYDEIPVG